MGCGQRIKEFMREYHISQKYLARETKIPQTTISGYLKQNRAIPEDRLIQIISCLNISADYVYGLTRYPGMPTDPKRLERQLLEDYRALTPKQRTYIRDTIKLLQAQNTKK